MSAANFQTMRDFSLFAKDYMCEGKRCPVCGVILSDDCDECEVCGSEDLEDCSYFDELTFEFERGEIVKALDDFNDGLLFHKVTLQGGYCYGVQFYVDCEYYMDVFDDNDDCHYYFDCCRSVARRKYESEVRKINRKLAALGKCWGFTELVCTARFSNGEAMFAPASNDRARMYAAIA